MDSKEWFVVNHCEQSGDVIDMMMNWPDIGKEGIIYYLTADLSKKQNVFFVLVLTHSLILVVMYCTYICQYRFHHHHYTKEMIDILYSNMEGTITSELAKFTNLSKLHIFGSFCRRFCIFVAMMLHLRMYSPYNILSTVHLSASFRRMSVNIII